MSKSAYAKYRGVSRQTVYDWIKKNEVVVTGNKIDVEATERHQQPTETKGGQWAHRTQEMTWGDFWKAVMAGDKKAPAPSTPKEIRQCVMHAADEMNWSVEFLSDGGIYLDDGDAEHYFQQYDLKQNAELAIGLFRREVCYVAMECPDELDNWSPAGIAALALWGDKPKE